MPQQHDEFTLINIEINARTSIFAEATSFAEAPRAKDWGKVWRYGNHTAQWRMDSIPSEASPQ
jgi:hypothetical protein